LDDFHALVFPMNAEPKEIEKVVELNAPVSRVWRALTDFREFGEWFRVKLDGPFAEGQVSTGQITYPGYEHLKWEAVVQQIMPQSMFSFTWHPHAIDPNVDYSAESPTWVTFRLEPIAGGCSLRVVESGFEHVPEHRRAEAFEMNEGGWEEQMNNIAAHVSADS
jgi:uncharacterized protein YndB with AHSA1/START domain